MKAVKVVKAFADKEIKFKMYAVGETISLPDERALNAIEKGLAIEAKTKETKIEEVEESEIPEAKVETKKKRKKKG